MIEGNEGRTAAQEKWLRFFNRVIYNSLSRLYDSLDWLTFGAWWRLVRRALEYVPSGGAVLEVGFGPGRLLVELSRRAERCAGLDLAWGMCRLARQRMRRANQSPLITRGSVFTLPYADNTFDTVVSTFAFSGFPDGPDAMREMVRVTRPGGRVVLIAIGLPPDGNRLGIFLARLWERMGDFLYDQPALMAGAGLKVVTFEPFGPGHHIRAVVGEK